MERIVKLLEECSWDYPPTPHYKVELLDDSNNRITAHIPKARVEVIMKLIALRHESKLTHQEMLKLWELIDAFGDERYEQGGADELLSGAGASY